MSDNAIIPTFGFVGPAVTRFDVQAAVFSCNSIAAYHMCRVSRGALVHIHSLGIVHRDIKPDNIMFLDHAQSHAKLIDFGVAARLWASFTR